MKYCFPIFSSYCRKGQFKGISKTPNLPKIYPQNIVARHPMPRGHFVSCTFSGSRLLFRNRQQDFLLGCENAIEMEWRSQLEMSIEQAE